MDIGTLITDLEKHDETTKLTAAEFKDYLLTYQVHVALFLLGAGFISWLVLSSLYGFLILVAILLIGFYSYVLGQEKVIQNMIFADRHGIFWQKRAKISRFGYEGVIFGVGHSPRSYNAFSSVSLEHNFGVFHYCFYTGSGKHKRAHNYTVAYFDLPKELPHILLDSAHNDQLLESSIPRSLDKDYRVSLEGNFDKYFKLYTAYPKPAEALTIISPDVMQTLIKEAPGVDIEILNRRLWVYIPKKTNYTTYAKALKAGLAVLTSASNNVKHYKMDDLTSLLAQDKNRKKLVKQSAFGGIIIVIIYVIYLLIAF